ncbi:MAG: GDP-mannose 4,6-dehydratase [Candidatus Eremiobacteraeota bacterium]|nr:GDP-mannose 4,6-dehydratase [Candidatus Eremiobacteraeota bacterium]
MRALVTGASGFVGRYLVDALRRDGADVVACGGPHDGGSDCVPLDLGDLATIRAAVDAATPSVIFHLAAQTFVPDSFASPLLAYQTNAIGTALLTQAVRECAARSGATPRIVFASSAEVYGRRSPEELPAREHLDLRPATPYAASKAAAEAILLAESRSFGLDVVVARAFNHIGPGQDERFAVAAFASALARIAAGAPPVLLVGNIETARDFLDVRDVVAAYVALARVGERGEVYNVCSGSAIKIRDILRELVSIAHVPVEIREDPARMRPSDVPLFVGNPEKLRLRTGWQPSIPLARSLRDAYDRARAVIAQVEVR